MDQVCYLIIGLLYLGYILNLWNVSGIRKCVSKWRVSANHNTAHSTKLSVPATEVCLATTSPSAIQNMWHKAERLLTTPNAITPAPGNENARMVASDSSSRPHFVHKTMGNKFLCDENCPMWMG